MSKRRFLFMLPIFLLGFFIPGKSTVTSTTQGAELAYHVYIPLVIYDSPQVATAWIGPGGGVITDLATDPNNSQIVYAAAWGGGIYKSVDSGQSWQRTNYGLDSLNINALEVAPKNSLILYAGAYR
ncbi:MAG: hypothetical protein IMY76_08400, partial [Chloroflexi bacterium]|nr:hypothetical protein [Chloroflexota bacterium]